MLRCEPYFPSRCEPATHQSIDAFSDGEVVRLNGRLTNFSKREGVLADECGSLPFSCGEHTVIPPSVVPGDFVSLVGHCSRGVVSADAISILSPAQRRVAGDCNHGELASRARSIAQLKKRSAILAAVRSFFASQGFSKVETPTLSRAPSQETHVASFETVFGGGGKARDVRYLVTSPEHDMKALLGVGFEKIYQICRCFRNGESTPTHNPEFTMVEWYRSFADYEAISRDVENLVSHVCREVLGSTTILYRGRNIDLQPPWCVISVREAFRRFASIDLDTCHSAEAFTKAASKGEGSESLADDDSWEEIFFKLFIERVEPRLIDLGPVLLVDFPAPLASLSRLSETDPQVAERVEAYIGGLEVANGFTELNDPRQQRSRFMAQREERKGMDGAEVSAIDEQFLHMMARGMPPAAGVAVGLDRLVMLLTDTARIEDVLAFPFQERSYR